MNDVNKRVLVLSYYNPWISGGAHRPICLAEQDIYNGKQVLFCFESEAEVEEMNKFEMFYEKNLLIVKRDSKTGLVSAMNESAAKVFSQEVADIDMLKIWRPQYVRSHNPVSSYIDLLKYCQEKGIKHIYDQMDYWDDFAVQPWGADSEKKYIELADECVTVSNWLKNLNPNFYVIPNGIKNNFLLNIQQTYKEVSDRSKENKKRIVYSGAIWPDWFDWNIVLRLVRERPEYEFVFIGPYIPSSDEDDNRDVVNIVSNLKKQNNVMFTGRLQHEEIIPILKSAHVAIIPFVVNNITQACSPLKYYEYLAAYLPTVSTIPSENIDDHLFEYAKDCDDFINKIDLSLKKDISFEVYKKTKKFIENNTWENRIKKFEQLVDKC